MKKFISISGVFLCTVLLIISCDKEHKYLAVPLSPQGQAFLRVVHVSPNFRAIQAFPDSFHLFVGKQKVNGTLLTYNSAFPSATINNNTYAAVPAGSQQVRFSLIGVNNVDSITVLSVQKVLEAGKYYTLFITDSIHNNQDPTRIWTEDNFTVPATGKFALRFVHAILNDTVGRRVDVYSQRRAMNIFSNVTPGTATNFVDTFSTTSLSDTIVIRRTGTGFELARLSTVTFSHQRVYTILYRGSPGLTTGTKARGVMIINNR